MVPTDSTEGIRPQQSDHNPKRTKKPNVTGKPPGKKEKKKSSTARTKRIANVSVKNLVDKVTLVALVFSLFDDSGAIYGVISRGRSPIPILIGILGIVLTGLLLLITKRKWLSEEQLHRASTITLVALFIGYCYAPFQVEIFGRPNFWDSLSSFGFLWILVVVTECSIITRVSTPDSSHRVGHVALIVAISLVGTSVMGLAAASGSIAVRSFQLQDAMTAWTLCGQATALAILSMTLLIARRLVVAMALFSYGPVAIGFGIAAILNEDWAFGYSVVAVGILSAIVGFAVALGNATVIGCILLVGAVGGGVSAGTSLGTGVLATGLEFIVLTAALALTGAAFLIWRPTDPWRRKNDIDEWSPTRYKLVSLAAFTVSLCLVVVAVASVNSQHTGATAAVLALGAGSFAVATTTSAAGLHERRLRALHERIDELEAFDA